MTGFVEAVPCFPLSASCVLLALLPFLPASNIPPSISTMNPVICEAIRARRLLIFGYGNAVRVVEPHLYGVNTAGHEALSAWLRAGLSRADPDGGWRMYLTDEVRGVQALPEIFGAPREGYNPDDPHFTRVYCRIEGAGDGATPLHPAESGGS